MEEVWKAAILIFFTALLIGIPTYEFKRRNRVKNWAKGRGWTFEPYPDGALAHTFVPPYGDGFDYAVLNLCSSKVGGTTVAAFEFRWVEATEGKVIGPRMANAVRVQLPAALPPVDVRRESFSGKIANSLGPRDIQKDIDTESAEFNQAWRVRSPDLKSASDVLHPRVIERLLKPDALKTGVRFDGDALFSWERGRLDPATVDARCNVLLEVRDLVPRHVWLDHGHDPNLEPSASPNAEQPRP